MQPCFIMDLDGTLADGDHRLHHIKKEPKDWKTYFSECGGDAPIGHMVDVFHSLAAEHYIFICSGRSDEVRDITMAWLRAHVTSPGRNFEDVLMRKAGDHRPDDVIKIEMLAEIRRRGFEPLMAFDDRFRVVEAWRRAGIPCAQVAPGDF